MSELKDKVDISTLACIVKTQPRADDGADLFNFALIEEQWKEHPGRTA